MKKLNLTTSLAIAVFFTLIFTSCNKQANRPERETAHRLEANLVMDKLLFTASAKERNSENVFEILGISRKNEILHVKVKGGGSAESFQFIWDGVILFSYPASIQLLLKYHNSNQDFDPDKEMTISVNLKKILGDKHNVNDFYFNVINGSKLQTAILNPNGSTTKENK